MWQRVVIFIDQASHVLERGRALLVRGQEKLKHPAGLPHEAEIRQIAGLTLLVSRCQHGHEGRLSVETHAPAVRRGVLGDVARPRLRVDLPEGLAKAPEQPVVLLQRALPLRVGREHDEGGVAAVSVGLRVVGEDGAGDEEDVGALRAVFGGEEQVDEVVVLPSLGGVYAGEDFLLVAEFGGEGIVGFALPRVFVELLHDLIPAGFSVGEFRDVGRLGGWKGGKERTC